MIDAELTRLDALIVKPVLSYIINTFEGLTFDPGDSPTEQLSSQLRQLNPPISHLDIATIVSKLDAFSYRAHSVNTAGLPIYWNPLICKFTDFYPDSKKIVTQSESEFPCSDIVFHFFCNYVKQGLPHSSEQ